MYYTHQASDLIRQGRLIVIGVSTAFLIAWVLEFFTYPAFLVPGLFFDRSLGMFLLFMSMVVQFGIFSLCSLLLWAGLGWVRYVFGGYLLIAGLANVIISITLGALGGPQLILGGVYLVSAAALVLSLSVTRYVEERRRMGIPWLSTCLATLFLPFIFLSVISIQFIQAWMMVHNEREEAAFAYDILQKFSTSLDSRVIAQAGDDNLKQSLIESDFADQCAELKRKVGDFQGFNRPAPPSFAALVLNPPGGTAMTCCATARYKSGGLIFYLELDVSRQPWVVSQVSVSEFNK